MNQYNKYKYPMNNEKVDVRKITVGFPSYSSSSDESENEDSRIGNNKWCFVWRPTVDLCKPTQNRC